MGTYEKIRSLLKEVALELAKKVDSLSFSEDEEGAIQEVAFIKTAEPDFYHEINLIPKVKNGKLYWVSEGGEWLTATDLVESVFVREFVYWESVLIGILEDVLKMKGVVE